MKLFFPPGFSEWMLFAVLLSGIALFIAAAELVRKKFNRSPEVTRKLVHILTGVLIYFAPQLFNSGIPAILLALIFIIVNFAAERFDLLKGMHGTNRRSYGTVYYPLAFLILVLLFWNETPAIISISILVLAISDAAAAIVGGNLSSPHNYFLTSDKKSLEGSVTMFVATFLVVVLALRFNPLTAISNIGFLVLAGFAVASFATMWEAISSKGFDNLTVPLAAAFILHFLLTPLPHHHAGQLLLGIFLAATIAVVSLRFHFLKPSGSAATFLLATIIFGIGGWQWTVPILTFFVASSLLSKFGKKRKSAFDLLFEKSDTRDAGQVAANGGVTGMLMLCWYVAPSNEFWYPLYLASLAAVTADTWGTEIGVLAHASPRSILTMKRVETGTSGGVSLAGIVGGACGAFLIALSGSFWYGLDVRLVVFVVLSGIAGSLADSFLGATIQAQYRCVMCGKVTEKKRHCEKETSLVRGVRWINNDIVNWVCAIVGVSVMAVL